MKRKIFILSVLYSSFLLNIYASSCSVSSTEEWEAFGDTAFEKGFALTPLDPLIVQTKGGFEKTCVDTLYFKNTDVLPVWRMSQWYSRHDLANTLPVKKADGTVSYSNQGKTVIRKPDGSLWLEVNTSKEYDSPREVNASWPHLLIEQDFARHPNLGKVKQLIFSMALKLEKCERKLSDNEFNPELHTAQSPFYFILKNVNEQSKDFNSFIWFGIPSYDYRYSEMSNDSSVSWDPGTSTYIYNVPQLPVWGDISFHDKQWHQAKVDILPFIREGIEAMRAKGYFKDTEWDDLEICGMNFGWEIPGTFDAAISVKNLSLKVIDGKKVH